MPRVRGSTYCSTAVQEPQSFSFDALVIASGGVGAVLSDSDFEMLKGAPEI